MATLISMTEQLAAAVLLATPDDLAGWARLHEQLKTVSNTAELERDTLGGASLEIAGAAQQASELVERIILREFDDTNAAIEQVCRQIGQIQQLITCPGEGGGQAARSPGSEACAAQSAPVTSAAPAHPKRSILTGKANRCRRRKTCP